MNMLASDRLPGVTVHFGVGEYDTWIEALEEGDVVFDIDGGGSRRYSQEGALRALQVLDEKIETPPERGCRVCDAPMIPLGAIDGECIDCGVSKRHEVRDIWENREQVREEMQMFEEEYGSFGPGKQAEPVEIGVRSALTCPNGHYICSDCLMRRDQE